MATCPSVKISKSSTFKGGQRIWSNRYHFLGGTPPDTTHWNSLFDAITAAEKLCFPSDVKIVLATGYAAGSDVPVAEKVYSLACTLTPTGTEDSCPGEAASLVRYSTDGRTSKNHPIYLFNYYHRAMYNSAVNADSLAPTMKTALNTYAGKWLTGFSDGGTVTATRCSPRSQAATGVVVEEWITHRDFPYSSSL